MVILCYAEASAHRTATHLVLAVLVRHVLLQTLFTTEQFRTFFTFEQLVTWKKKTTPQLNTGTRIIASMLHHSFLRSKHGFCSSMYASSEGHALCVLCIIC